MKLQRAHLPWLDWIRFLAALEVALYHLRPFLLQSVRTSGGPQIGVALKAWFLLTSFGGQAVIVFFILSGMLVGGGVIRRVEEGRFDTTDYAIDRFARIVIPYWPALIVAVVTGRLIGLTSSPATFLGHVVFLQGAVVDTMPEAGWSWSLAYEMWFYILAGACAILLTRGARGHLAAFFILCGGVLVFSGLRPVLLLCWIIGAFAARLGDRVKLPLCLAGLVVAGVGLWLSDVSLAPSWPAVIAHAAWRDDFADVLISIGGAFALAWLINRHPVSRAGQSFEQMGTKLAAFSYSLYLTHRSTYAFMNAYVVSPGQPLTLRSAGYYILFVGAALLFAWIFYWIFERRTPAFKAMLRAVIARRRTGERVAPIGAS